MAEAKTHPHIFRRRGNLAERQITLNKLQNKWLKIKTAMVAPCEKKDGAERRQKKKQKSGGGEGFGG